MQLSLRPALLASRLHWKRWQRITDNPCAEQTRLLLKIVGQNQDTRFGREHGFRFITTIDDYRKQVAIGDFEDFRPYIERAKLGERAVLTEEPILMFTMTSGSTGEPKLIPVTESSRASHAKLTRLWYGRAIDDHPGCGAGRIFGLVGSASEGSTASGIPYGAASGLIYQSSPSWVRRAHALPYAIAAIKDFQAKYYTAMRLAVEQNVTFLGTPNPSTILRLVETADRCSADIIKDIYDGGISDRFEIPARLRSELSAQLEPNLQRALELEQFIKRTERLRPIDYWPGLRLIGCWKGGSVGIRLKEFAAWFGSNMPVRDLGYMASEAQMSLPISDVGSSGILAIDANFYEFFAESEISSAQPRTLGCDELEVGAVYYLILTTGAGLYRYDINDLVRVTGFHGETPLIEFLRKGRDITNITGEKLHVNQLIQAVAQAQNTARVAIRHFHGCADVDKSRYAFAVELDGTVPEPQALTVLLRELDASLQALNIEYGQKRQSQRLNAPVLQIMKPGWFERKTGVALRNGAPDSQYKPQLLTAVPEDPTEILCETNHDEFIPHVRESV
jgi:GH3 auxin-responsive promoter